MIVRARAPLRLGLAGGGTDVAPYSNRFGGYVMNATIDKYAYAILDRGAGDQVELAALDRGVSRTAPPEGCADALPSELQLHGGVYARICRDFLDDRRPPLRIRTFCDAPPGSGLGSSSTLVVALVTAFCEYFSLPLGEYEVARLAYDIERKDLALAGGKQDQYAAAFGGFNFMEFHADDRVVVNPLRVKDAVKAELEACLTLYFTGVSRDSDRIIDEQSRNTSANVQDAVDAMHALKEEAVLMKEAILKGDIRRFADTLQRGWVAKKRMAGGITNPMIDRLEVLARANGACAAKVSGAGGGGFMMFVSDPADRVRLAAALRAESGALVDFHFNPDGAVAWKAGLVNADACP